LTPRWPWVGLLLLALAGSYIVLFSPKGENTLPAIEAQEMLQETLTDQQARVLATQKVFFGHQSVGDNIVQGIRDILSADARLKLNLVESKSPEAVHAPAFVETHIGQNTDPQSKNSDLLAIMNQGFAGIAMFKYCYVDIGETTDVQQMFNAYRATIDEVHHGHPGVRIVHTTVPLTTVDSSPKTWLKSILGRNTAQDDNIKRNHFNRLLLETYGNEPIFDLAKVESTHGDGSRSFFRNGNETIYTLAAEYTSDGAHLNQAGRQLAAGRLLQVLAEVQ
jgi:hypothetical protein